MYNSELMMASLVASTTFLGITGVILQQMVMSKYWPHPMLKVARVRLRTSLWLGYIVIISAIMWFISPSSIASIIRTVSLGSFLSQLGLCIPISFAWWASRK
jgi:hypothetical protein